MRGFVNDDDAVFSRIVVSGDHWLWPNPEKAGYGRVYIRGARWRAHRWFFRYFWGPIPKGKIVCHTCDIPNCAHPSHLFLGSTRDNVADKVRKGRQARGTSQGNAKLDDEKVRAIRALRGAESGRRVAERYGVSQFAIQSIWLGKTWSHVQ